MDTAAASPSSPCPALLNRGPIWTKPSPLAREGGKGGGGGRGGGAGRTSPYRSSKSTTATFLEVPRLSLSKWFGRGAKFYSVQPIEQRVKRDAAPGRSCPPRHAQKTQLEPSAASRVTVSPPERVDVSMSAASGTAKERQPRTVNVEHFRSNRKPTVPTQRQAPLPKVLFRQAPRENWPTPRLMLMEGTRQVQI